jgi:hypothetical protein
MRLIAAGLFAIALAILVHAAVMLYTDRETCMLGGGEGLPVRAVDCTGMR